MDEDKLLHGKGKDELFKFLETFINMMSYYYCYKKWLAILIRCVINVYPVLLHMAVELGCLNINFW